MGLYEYKATLIKVVDGDTVDLKIDLGFYMSAALRFRILGVDTPELRGGTQETKSRALIAKRFVEERLELAERIVVRTEKADSFGRWLADLKYWLPGFSNPISLAEELLNEGLAVRRTR